MVPRAPEAAAAALLLAGAWITVPRARRAAEVAGLRRECRDRRLLVLSYDDGPGPIITPRVLHVLAEHDATATFFALGRAAEPHGTVLDEVQKQGHEIGCHSYAHRDPWRSSPRAAVRDLDHGYEVLRPWVRPDGLFRPPHGRSTPLTRLAVARRRAAHGWWTIDSGDTHAVLPPPHSVVERVRREGGGVVLLHDFDGTRPAERLDFVVEVTRLLLEAAPSEGWHPVTLGQALAST